MKKATWLSMILLTAMIFILAACGPDREETGADEADVSEGEEPEKPESLKVWVNDDDNQKEFYEEVTEEFTEETGISVEIEHHPMDEQLDKVSLDGPSGNGPDLFYQPHDMIGEANLQGLVSPIQADEEQLSIYEDSAIEAMSYEGELYGVPDVTETYALLYNKELVEEAPETISDLEEIAEELTDASNEEYGFLMEAANFYYTYPFMTAEGGYVFNQDEDGTYDSSDIGLANEGAVEGAEMIQSWYQNDYIPKGINDDILNGLFEDGKVGAVINGTWAVKDYVKAIGSENLGVAPLPTTDDGDPLNSFSGVKGWLVSNYSEDKYWASQLGLHITNTENAKKYHEASGQIPAVTEVVESDVLQENEHFNGFAEQTQYAEPMPNIPEMAQVWEPMGDAHEYIADGNDPEEVLNEAVEEIQAEIEMQAK
ncbi:sugar ABC transporter substrate-binding protein [Alteribacillus bidgolensis]|uniref:Maltodextrin-binding protein n=1 Tax=Alteribacillus bidgolensis TaxID=930129 RepID=A0A1G8J2N5_9BACI|nr:extracellular solute-binding protein [Alteribacillus bidgolensis]SDI25391.1 carbohydrate ABC transporter substrate-binding protein, CUT1 family [Alteribacillus bidgolensis]